MLFAVALSSDGATVAAGGWTQFNDGKFATAPDGDAVYLLDRATGRVLKRLGGLPDTVNDLAFSPTGVTSLPA
jgi:hypothetical protein